MKGFGLFRKDAVDSVAGHAAFLEGVVDRMRGERDAARERAARLEAALLDAPHADDCGVHVVHIAEGCTCWKARALS